MRSTAAKRANLTTDCAFFGVQWRWSVLAAVYAVRHHLLGAEFATPKVTALKETEAPELEAPGSAADQAAVIASAGPDHSCAVSDTAQIRYRGGGDLASSRMGHKCRASCDLNCIIPAARLGDQLGSRCASLNRLL